MHNLENPRSLGPLFRNIKFLFTLNANTHSDYYLFFRIKSCLYYSYFENILYSMEQKYYRGMSSRSVVLLVFIVFPKINLSRNIDLHVGYFSVKYFKENWPVFMLNSKKLTKIQDKQLDVFCGLELKSSHPQRYNMFTLYWALVIYLLFNFY